MFYMQIPGSWNYGKINLPSSGTDMEVGGIISASNKKNTVSERRIEMDRDTYFKKVKPFKCCSEGILCYTGSNSCSEVSVLS